MASNASRFSSCSVRHAQAPTDRQPASQTGRQTDRQAGRQAGKQTDSQTGRQTGRQADRQTAREGERKREREREKEREREGVRESAVTVVCICKSRHARAYEQTIIRQYPSQASQPVSQIQAHAIRSIQAQASKIDRRGRASAKSDMVKQTIAT